MAPPRKARAIAAEARATAAEAALAASEAAHAAAEARASAADEGKAAAEARASATEAALARQRCDATALNGMSLEAIEAMSHEHAANGERLRLRLVEARHETAGMSQPAPYFLSKDFAQAVQLAINAAARGNEKATESETLRAVGNHLIKQAGPTTSEDRQCQTVGWKLLEQLEEREKELDARDKQLEDRREAHKKDVKREEGIRRLNQDNAPHDDEAGRSEWIRVWWSDDSKWHTGVVAHADEQAVTVWYEDGDRGQHNLASERWERLSPEEVRAAAAASFHVIGAENA
jgi:hypothetical protein